MKLVPEIKELKARNGTLNIGKLKWKFCSDIDERVKKAAYRICDSEEDGVLVTIEHKQADDESYSIKITDEILISANGAAGAFYALQTLGILKEQNGGVVECCDIFDEPDMKYRGFYHDTSRGRVPKLESLKRLVDAMVKFKMNSLQLYTEHTYEFKEYSECSDKFGYLTKNEIRELDEYCKERFVELVPSLAMFGHIYELLRCEDYKHLNAYAEYKPTEHYYIERQKHHTLNPLLPESLVVVKSLIDQYLEAFSSDKFNICCDETCDLGRCVDESEEAGKIYFDFVKKIIDYVKSTGKIKTIMMWGDVAIRHPEYIKELPDYVILIDWNYSKEPLADVREQYRALNRKLIVSPATCGFWEFTERMGESELNIPAMAEYGYKANALGMLNTNWGDYGHIGSYEAVIHGMALGAAVSWRRGTVSDDEFKKAVSQIHYGNDETVNILSKIRDLRVDYAWGKLLRPNNPNPSKPSGKTKTEMSDMLKGLKELHERLKALPFKDEFVKKELISTIDGQALLLKWICIKEGIECECYVDFEKWLKNYQENWLRENKQSELGELVYQFTEINKGNYPVI